MLGKQWLACGSVELLREAWPLQCGDSCALADAVCPCSCLLWVSCLQSVAWSGVSPRSFFRCGVRVPGGSRAVVPGVLGRGP